MGLLKEFYDYFIEYRNKKLISTFTLMYFNDDLVRYFTKNGICTRAIKKDIMDLLIIRNLKTGKVFAKEVFLILCKIITFPLLLYFGLYKR